MPRLQQKTVPIKFKARDIDLLQSLRWIHKSIIPSVILIFHHIWRKSADLKKLVADCAIKQKADIVLNELRTRRVS